MAKREAQLAELEDVHADFKQDIKRLNARTESITRDMEQVATIEVEPKKVRAAMEEQVNVFSKDF